MTRRAAASARTLNPTTIAFDATARFASVSLMPPAAAETTLTFTSSVVSCVRASRSASTEPCTSALTMMLSVLVSPSFICSKTFSSFDACCRASLTSRYFPCLKLAISRALRSSATTTASSPASGGPDRPSTSTGVDGPADGVSAPASSNSPRTRPNSWPARRMSPFASRPDCTSTVATGPRPRSIRDSTTTPRAGPSSAATSSSTSDWRLMASSRSSTP